MDFEQSSQSRYFLFDQETLVRCKQDACLVECLQTGKRGLPLKPKVKNSACGYHKRQNNENESLLRRESASVWTGQTPEDSPRLATNDQDLLVHFHAHQIQRLVGPNAIFPELRRSSTALSTAIMLFRRFYLSNSIIDFEPRPMAAAAALLALKADCEPSLPIAILSHATAMVNRRRFTVNENHLYHEELRTVSTREIEEAERKLLVGLDYRLRCHHPYGAIRALSNEVVSSIMSGHFGLEKRGSCEDVYGYRSPRGANEFYSDDRLDNLCERALAVAQAALVYSDVNFLFPPGKVAFASVAIALEGNVVNGRLGSLMQGYLRSRFPQKEPEDIAAFERDVLDIIFEIDTCPEIDVAKFGSPYYRRFNSAARCHAQEIRRAFSVAAYFRHMSKALQDAAGHSQHEYPRSSKKRERHENFLHCREPKQCKVARSVTPTPCFRRIT